MKDPIHDIVQRLALIEGRITPAEPTGDQNPQQKSVNQLPALFKPGKGGPILGGNPNKPAVTKGYFVGAESEEKDEEPIEEAVANEEKLLDKVKKSFIDYLDSVEDTMAKKKDRDISSKARSKDISKKAVDKDIVSKNPEIEEEQLDEFLPALAGLAGAELGGAAAGALGADALGTVALRGLGGIAGRSLATSDDEVNEDPTDLETTTDMPTAPIQEPTFAGASAAPVKTVAMEDGTVCEIHGDDHTGFEIRRGNRRLPSRFKNLDHATLALEMYMARRKASQDQNADYIEEA